MLLPGSCDGISHTRRRTVSDDQVAVRLGHGVRVDIQALRKLADSRKLVARFKMAGRYSILDVVFDLRVYSHAALQVDGREQVKQIVIGFVHWPWHGNVSPRRHCGLGWTWQGWRVTVEWLLGSRAETRVG